MSDPVDPGAHPAGEGAHGVQIRTFLIVDIRGWTRFTQERGDEAAAELAGRFADVAGEVVEARGGAVLELRGDEAMCVFSSAREAIRAAVELQLRFVRETLERPDLPLTAGIGLDAGEAVPVAGGYRGGALNLAARLCSRARAGEILASREVTHLARAVDGVRYEDPRPLTLKGMRDPVAVVRVVPAAEDPVDRLRPFVRATPGRERAPERRTVGVAIAVAAVLALVAASVSLIRRGGDDLTTLEANSIARIDPGGDAALELASSLGQRPGASAIGFGSLWVAQPDRGRVVRVDLDDPSIQDAIEVGGSPSGIAIGQGSVWVTNAADGTVSRINVDLNSESDTLPAGAVPSGLAVGGGALWVADSVGGALLRIDPTSGARRAIALPGQPSGVAFTPDGVWVSIAPATVARIDPDDGSVLFTKPVGSGPTAVLAAFGSIWVANHLDGTVTRLDPSTGAERATIAAGGGPGGLVAVGGSVWVADEFDASIVEIDPRSNRVERTVPIGGSAASLAVQRDRLWLAVGASPTEHRGGTLVMSSGGRLPQLDPAVHDPDAWGILTITNDGLLAYKRVSGPDGASLVPDLAAALPEVSADGLTYRFPLRQGIRYSTGGPVRPEDFRRAIERALVLSDSSGLLLAIRGAAACAEDPPSCDLSQGIEVDEESVTFHLVEPDAELPFKLAMPFAFPVPADTPMENQRWEALPATGPYVVEQAGPARIELVRNPEFREWSEAAQPDGFVDAISWLADADAGAAFDRLTAGSIDLMLDRPAGEDLDALLAAHPDRVVTWSGAVTAFLGFDVRQPPFDDARVRRAVNYAVDRDRIVDLLGGPTAQRATCQILPPNFQGYEPFCPYTIEPAAGVWSGADLGRADRLIGEAGVAGDRVTVAIPAGDDPGAVAAVRYVAGVLRDLGLRPDVQTVSLGDWYRSVFPPSARPGTPAHPDLVLAVWFGEYPGAGNMLAAQFSCGPYGFANTSGWCSAALDDRMDGALRLFTTDPGAASREWTAIEHRLVLDAAQAPLTNPVTILAVSGRVGNVQVNPQWGILLSRLWVE